MAFKFLKTGAESAKLAEKHKAEQEARKNDNKAFRYWLKQGEEGRVTFVDGELSPTGHLNPPRYYEHSLYLNGTWNNFFVCPEKTNPELKDKCPICESGDRPALVSLFTVIDHRESKSKDGTKTYKDQKRLLVAKTQTFEILNKLAQLQEGLVGLQCHVARTGDKAPAVGSMFMPVVKKPLEECKSIYMMEKVDPKTNQKTKVTNFTPLDYEKEIVYRTGDELRKLGLGKSEESVGVASSMDASSGSAPDYSDQL